MNITIWLYLVSFPGHSQTVSHSHGGKTSSLKTRAKRRREAWYFHRGNDVNVYLGRQRGGGVQMTLKCFTRCVSPRAEVLTWMLAKWTKLFRMKNVGPLPLFLSWGHLPPLSTYVAIGVITTHLYCRKSKWMVHGTCGTIYLLEVWSGMPSEPQASSLVFLHTHTHRGDQTITHQLQLCLCPRETTYQVHWVRSSSASELLECPTVEEAVSSKSMSVQRCGFLTRARSV